MSGNFDELLEYFDTLYEKLVEEEFDFSQAYLAISKRFKDEIKKDPNAPEGYDMGTITRAIRDCIYSHKEENKTNKTNNEVASLSQSLSAKQNNNNDENNDDSTDENNDNDEIKDEKPVKPVRTPISRQPRTPRTKTNSVESSDMIKRLVENPVKSRDVNISKTVSRVEFSNPEANGINMIVDDAKFQYNPNAHEIKDFDKAADIMDAEVQLVSLVVGNEKSAEFFNDCVAYKEAISDLRVKYALHDGSKKVQKFTGPTKAKKYKYVNPNTDKLDELPVEDSAALEKFDNSQKAFEKVWKACISSEAFDSIDYLKCDVIRTQNILKFDVLKELYHDVEQEFTSKITNTYRTTDRNGKSSNISEKSLFGYRGPTFAPDYFQLFADLKKFTPAQFVHIIKNIYTHRIGIISHPKCSPEFKKAHWIQALNNINSINDETLNECTPREISVIDAWRNVLSSCYAYHVVMNCVPESSLFEKAMCDLIQEGTSIKLFENVLYPISFVFTPFMLGINGLGRNSKESLTKVSVAAYNKMVKEIFNSFGDIQLKYFDYDECNWLYYAENTNVENYTLKMLHYAVLSVSTEKKAKRTRGGKTDESEAETETEEQN